MFYIIDSIFLIIFIWLLVSVYLDTRLTKRQKAIKKLKKKYE